MDNSICKQYRAQVMSVSAMLWRVLEQWKVFLVVVTASVLAFLGFMYWHSYNAKSNAVSINKEEAVSYESVINKLTEEEKKAVIQAYMLAKQLQNTNEYINSSLLMNADLNNSRKYRTSWVVRTNDDSDEGVLAAAYIDYLQSEETCARIAQYYGKEVTAQQVRELLFFDDSDRDMKGYFYCEIILTDSVQLDLLEDEFINCMNAAKEQFSNAITEHSLYNLNKEVIKGADISLIEKQDNAYRFVDNKNKQLTNLQSSFSPEQKKAYQELIDHKKDEKAESLRSSVISIKNILIGIVVGVFLFLCGFIVRIVMLDRVYCAEDLVGSTGLFILGEWYDDSWSSRIRSFKQDRLAYRRHHKKHLNKQNYIDRTAKTLSTVVCDDAKRIIFIMTASMGREKSSVITSVQNRLSSINNTIESITVTADQDGLYDCSFEKDDKAVLVVIENKSSFKEVDTMLKECSFFNVPVLGVIYLG